LVDRFAPAATRAAAQYLDEAQFEHKHLLKTK